MVFLGPTPHLIDSPRSRLKINYFKNEPILDEVFSLVNDGWKHLNFDEIKSQRATNIKSSKASNSLDSFLEHVSCSQKDMQLSGIGQYLTEPAITDKNLLEY